MTSRWSRPGRIGWVVFALVLGVVGQGAAAGLSGESTFSVNGVFDVNLSPKGTWASARARLGERGGLLVQHSASGAVEPIIASEDSIAYAAWVDDDTVIVAFYSVGRYSYVLIDLAYRNGKIVSYSSRTRSRGGLIDPIPSADDEVLWATVDGGSTYLHRLTTAQLLEQGERKTARGFEARIGEAVLKIQGGARSWLTDADGEPQVVVRPSRDGEEIWIERRAKRGKGFETVYRYYENDESAELKPVALVPGTRRFYVVGYAGKDTKGLHEYDPDAREIAREVFRREDVDVSGVIADDVTGELIAVETMIEGEEVLAYLDGFAERHTAELERLATKLPLESVHIGKVSPDRKTLLLHQRDAREPGRFLSYDVDADSLSVIGLWQSDLDRDRLSRVESLRVASKDGLEIEAYLTVPKEGSAPHPLVVMPHGGPHGVRDSRLYNPLVQYLASWGFAVLQPNYRGSAGYGREYLDSIKKQWAKAIEDDIDAAVEHVIARPDIDGDRICIVGGSYGGFSALASVVRHRDRYRCAVSVNGASDIPLLYDSSDMGDSKRVMDIYEEYVGSLETERAMLEDASPVYHVESIETPILFIYGDRDRRVDPDHSHRMMLMMDLLGKPYERLEIEGMAHSPSPIQWVIVMRSMRRMLTRHLLPGQTFEPDPEIGYEGVRRLKHRFDLDG